MCQCFKTTAMETETISKNNGTSLKDLSSMGNFLRKVKVIAIATTMSVAVYAQGKFGENSNYGVQAGVNLSTFSGIFKGLLPENNYDFPRKAGVQFGVFYESPFLKNPDWGLQGNLSFSNLGSRMERAELLGTVSYVEKATFSLNYLTARTHIYYNYAFTHDLALTLHSGLHAGYGLWGKVKYEELVNGVKINDDGDSFFGDISGAVELGIGFGAALTIQERFRVGVGYDFGIVFHNLSLSLTYMLGK